MNENVIVRNTATAKKVRVNVSVKPGFTEGIVIYRARSNCTAQLVRKGVTVVTGKELMVVIILPGHVFANLDTQGLIAGNAAFLVFMVMVARSSARTASFVISKQGSVHKTIVNQVMLGNFVRNGAKKVLTDLSVLKDAHLLVQILVILLLEIVFVQRDSLAIIVRFSAIPIFMVRIVENDASVRRTILCIVIMFTEHATVNLVTKARVVLDYAKRAILDKIATTNVSVPMVRRVILSQVPVYVHLVSWEIAVRKNVPSECTVKIVF